MTKLTDSEMEVYKRYFKMRGTNIHRCKVNSLNIHLNGDFEHEAAKFKIFWDLRKQGNKVITEAWDKDGKRRDIVDLSNDEIYEIEDSKKKRGHRHPPNINVFFYNTETWRVLEEK